MDAPASRLDPAQVGVQVRQGVVGREDLLECDAGFVLGRSELAHPGDPDGALTAAADPRRAGAVAYA